MNDNELYAYANLIWSDLNCISNANNTRQEEIELIKSRIIEIEKEARKTGRMQILNYLDDELKGLRSKS